MPFGIDDLIVIGITAIIGNRIGKRIGEWDNGECCDREKEEDEARRRRRQRSDER
jgi:hypothetical protein